MTISLQFRSRGSRLTIRGDNCSGSPRKLFKGKMSLSTEDLHRLSDREWLLICAFRSCPDKIQNTTERFVYAALHHSVAIAPNNVVRLFKTSSK